MLLHRMAPPVRSPYRGGVEALARYPLRSYPAYLSGIVVSIVLFPLLWFRLAMYADQLITWVILGLAVLTPPLAGLFLSGFRVSGHRSELRIFRDRIEVPHAFRREPIRLPLEQLRAVVYYFPGHMTGVRVDRPCYLVLEGPSGKRVLKAELFATAQAMEHATADIHRLQQGLELEAHDGIGPPRDEYDDKLDQELRGLD
jgi:hypothetical protein